ncbi:MAG TPA: radical SAM protein, partial [Nitrospiraceae bacterium]|nr:radical SAM protein [Nitrospiraceae bacterium]
TRGCYWGKCAFCYHGMIYQDRYRMREPNLIAADVERLHLRYNVDHFAFNDEALPPKLFRLLPDAIPKGKYFFTALYKFEKFFKPSDYQRMYDLGFRSLYIGLESASERIQAHMKKNNLQSTMVANLQGAHDAGIWNHTFVFFGFPTETESEANETIAFMLDHADIIHSEGTGTFSFEHNAPIYHDPPAFGVAEVLEKEGRYLELYYDYRPVSGLDADGAGEMLRKFDCAKKALGVYVRGRWIPREYLLLLLSLHGRSTLQRSLAEVERAVCPERVRDALGWIVSTDRSNRRRFFVVNKSSHQVFETNEDAVTVLSLLPSEAQVRAVVNMYPTMQAVFDIPRAERTAVA